MAYNRKSGGPHKMESLRKRTPDYTDIAYREAVARLRYLLAESYSPQSSPVKTSQLQMHRGNDSEDEIESVALSERSRHHHTHPHQHLLPTYRAPLYGSKRALFSDSTTKLPRTHSTQNIPADTADGSTKPEGPLPPPELMAFIERQEEYIEQLEKESQYCRDELGALLAKVKEVISENEGLHEREKAGLLKSVFDCFETGDEDDQEMESDGKSEKQKTQPKKKRLEGPSIVFESRISELEAQLTQTKMDLRKALEEADTYKKKLSDQPLGYEMSSGDCANHRQQIDTLQREKNELSENLAKLQVTLAQFREKEADATLKVKRSLDVVDQAQFEKAQVEKERSEEIVTTQVLKDSADSGIKKSKSRNEMVESKSKVVLTDEKKSEGIANVKTEEAEQELVQIEAQADLEVARLDIMQAELEVRRLKDELDRQHEKIRELLQEQGRKVQDERMQLERRYTQQMEQLSTDLTTQWDSSSKLQLDLEKQRRVETDLRRDLQQKTTTIEELKKELQNKIATMQNELLQAAVERGSLEQELAANRLAVERTERDGRQEATRLQAEVAALRQRLDRADADLMHSRRENIRLTEQIASLEREINLAKMTKESSETSSPSKQKSGQREKELAAMVMDMEAKHVQTVAELEGMIQSQNQVMEKLKVECHSLTEKLEESSARHKRDRVSLRQENALLMDKLGQLWEIQKQMTTLTPEILPSHSMQEQNSTTLSSMSSTNTTPLDNINMIQADSNMSSTNLMLPSHSSTNLMLPSHSSTNLMLPSHSSTNLMLPSHSSTNLILPSHSSTNLMLPNHSSTNPNLLTPSSTNPNLLTRSSTNLNLGSSCSRSRRLFSRMSRHQRRRPHLSLSPRRREIVETLPSSPPAPLTLEDLATDSDSSDSPSAQLGIFRKLF